MIKAKSILKLTEADDIKSLVDKLIKVIKARKLFDVYRRENELFTLSEFKALKDKLEHERRKEYGNNYVPYSVWQISDEAIVRMLPDLDKRVKDITWVKDLHLITIK